MLHEWFVALTHALQGAAVLALAAAFAWGVLSVLLSPCHLASIPLVVAFLQGQEARTLRRAMLLASAFALGILLTIAVIGVATAAAGRLAGDLGGWVYYAVAAVFFAVGLHLLGVLPLPQVGPRVSSPARRGVAAAVLLGVVFGAALGPCTFAFLAPVAAVTFHAAAERPTFAGLLLLSFGLGHCVVIVGAGVGADAAQRYLDWHERSRGGRWLRGACGVAVLAGGLYLLYTAP